MSGKTRNIDIAISRFAANSPGVEVLLYISEHKSVCYSFVTCISVHKYSDNFSSPCFSLPSQLFRTNSSFLLSPNFLDHAPRAETLNSRKYRMFIIIPSNHQNMSRNTIWLVNNTEFSVGHKTRLHCSLAKPFPWSSTTRPLSFRKVTLTCFQPFPWI